MPTSVQVSKILEETQQLCCSTQARPFFKFRYSFRAPCRGIVTICESIHRHLNRRFIGETTLLISNAKRFISNQSNPVADEEVYEITQMCAMRTFIRRCRSTPKIACHQKKTETTPPCAVGLCGAPSPFETTLNRQRRKRSSTSTPGR